MSPHRALNNDIFGNGLRERVSACRKRLRSNHLTHMAVVQNQADEVVPEATTSASECHGHPVDGETSKYPVRIDYCSIEFEGTEPFDSESLLLVGEQEVGIT